MPFQSSQDLETKAEKQLTDALLYPKLAIPFDQVGNDHWKSSRVPYSCIN
jgi:hypothetical protein